ncbi:hypothetical protein [Anabaena sp. WA102]|jgi:transposase|uniref:hypothetical protein n=1 Tax=Anabaena sp. WA102 TaxID=1647413 RepID=UPI000AB0CD63
MSSLKWLTRVPLTIKSAKNLVMSLAESEFVKSEKAGYSYAEKKITYGDIEQRWLIVQSQDRKKSDLKKLSKRIEKALTNTQSKLENLSQEKFACAADARKELTKISKEFKYHQVENIEVIEKSPKIKEENQLGKAINNPTMRWIFQCFQSVHLVTFQGKREFYNLTSEMKYILLFLPEACRNYYRYIS